MAESMMANLSLDENAESATLTETEIETFSKAFIELCKEACNAVIRGEVPHIAMEKKQLSSDEQGGPRTVWEQPFFSENVQVSHFLEPGVGPQQGSNFELSGMDGLCAVAQQILYGHPVEQVIWAVGPNSSTRPRICITYAAYRVNGAPCFAFGDIFIGLREENVFGVKRVIVQSIHSQVKWTRDIVHP
eukprot:scpid89256/ scgid26042/ 